MSRKKHLPKWLALLLVLVLGLLLIISLIKPSSQNSGSGDALNRHIAKPDTAALTATDAEPEAVPEEVERDSRPPRVQRAESGLARVLADMGC